MSGEHKVRHVTVRLDARPRRHFREERFHQWSPAALAAFGQELGGKGKQSHILFFPLRAVVQAQRLPFGPVSVGHFGACQGTNPHVAAFGFEAGLMVWDTHSVTIINDQES